MKVIEINAVPYGSTGMIAKEISNICNSEGNEAYFCYSWTKKRKNKAKKNEIIIGTFWGKLIHMTLSKITGWELNYSYFDTLLFLRKIKKIEPDIIHMHIMHSWYINIPLLFNYIKKNNIKIVWTFHDCWAFTGHCPYFDIVKCNKWKKKCCKCPSYRKYPKSFADNSEKMYSFKKKWFTLLDYNNVYIVTPSKWLKKLVEVSYMNKYRIYTINNGIELDKFNYVTGNFRDKYNCKNKIILLGVALDWGDRKGLDVFIRLSKDLPHNFQIVLVGTTKKIDMSLPSNIISIHKTHNREELIEIYSAADWFINPTREDNFPTVNIEAIACGLPVIAYNTGGCAEIIDNSCGCIIEKDNYNELLNKIMQLSDKKHLYTKNCYKRAKKFNKEEKFEEYIKLFNKIIEKDI